MDDNWMNKVVDGPMVDAINGVSGLLQKSTHASTASTLVSITLSREEWLELAKDVGVKSTIGAGIDGLFGLYKATLFYKEGRITKEEFAKHILSEVGCGFISSAAGNASSITVKIITGNNKSLSFLVGVGVSAGTRWVYRKVVPSVLPENQDVEEEGEEEKKPSLNEAIRDILERNQS